MLPIQKLTKKITLLNKAEELAVSLMSKDSRKEELNLLERKNFKEYEIHKNDLKNQLEATYHIQRIRNFKEIVRKTIIFYCLNMKKYKKIYAEYFGYCEGEFVPSELSGLPVVHIHHICYKSRRGGDNVKNLIALTAKEHEDAHKSVHKQEFLQKVHNEFMINRVPYYYWEQ